MRVLLDGHRLSADEVAELLATLGMQAFAQNLVADGYTMRPVRAPRRMPHNRLTFRLCWVAADPNAAMVVRLNATIDARAV